MSSTAAWNLSFPAGRRRRFWRGAAAEKAPLRWREAAAAEVRPLLARYLDSDLRRETDGLPARREWRFAFHLPDPGTGAAYTFTGRVDCLVDYRDGSFGIIDYKTDRAIRAAKRRPRPASMPSSSCCTPWRPRRPG
jgi:ATP-dependent exoDNAse (exonuclease V) beta subunit